MIKYWPQGEYTGDKGVKRQSLKAGLDTFDAAIAQINEWEQAHHLLWAWVDVRSNQGKKRVKLNKVGEEWSGVAKLYPREWTRALERLRLRPVLWTDIFSLRPRCWTP